MVDLFFLSGISPWITDKQVSIASIAIRVKLFSNLQSLSINLLEKDVALEVIFPIASYKL
tara:strand:- start:29 stop:208 length:180 start_codon:yes stop_codon:yes gene_type:complete